MSDPPLFKWRHFQADILKGQIKGIVKRDVLAQNHVINQLFGLAA